MVMERVDVRSSQTPLITCAEACLREHACEMFLYNHVSLECRWTSINRALVNLFPVDDQADEDQYSPDRFSTFEKNLTKVGVVLRVTGKCCVLRCCSVSCIDVKYCQLWFTRTFTQKKLKLNSFKTLSVAVR